MPQPYKVFTIYAREDAPYLKELRGQLRPLEYAGRIQVWSDREINPGMDWEQEIVHNLDTADIILILVSAAYYDSAYIHEKEIKYALKRHEKGEARVLPIIVRPCSFLDDPVISRLQVLPTDGKPVTDRRHWAERDDAWLDVVAGLKRTLDQLAEQEKKHQQAAQDQIAQEQDRAEQERLTRLRAQEAEQLRLADQAAWQKAETTDTVPAYQSYLNNFPQGRMAQDARARIKSLKKAAAPPLPLRKYAVYGGGALLLALAVWLAAKMFVNTDNGTVSEKKNAVQVDTAEVTKLASPLPNAKSGLEMVRAPGGSFTMGSPANEAGRYVDECQHTVSVGNFYIGRYEVTQADWRAIMGNNPSDHKNCDDCPVENVSWEDIQAFLKKLNARYPAKNYRLPTEAEWEYAARGGSNAPYLTYSGSNNLSATGWYSDNSGNQTHPVGAKQPNRLGLYDMSGNVWEWCQDTYVRYPCDSKRTAEGRARVGRGGGAFGDAASCRAAYRSYREPADRYHDFGFRLVSVSLQ